MTSQKLNSNSGPWCWQPRARATEPTCISDCLGTKMSLKAVLTHRILQLSKFFNFQNLVWINPGILIGQGRIEEILRLCVSFVEQAIYCRYGSVAFFHFFWLSNQWEQDKPVNDVLRRKL